MFITFNKRTLIRIISLSVITIFALICLLGIAPISETVARTKKLPIYSVDRNEKVVAITFDAAWGADKTLKIIEILKEYDADATFFLVGFWIEKYPDMVKSIHKNGFLIGNHSDNHLRMSSLREQEIQKEIKAVNEMIYELIGYRPKYFRAPFGDYNDLLITTMEEMGMMTIQWDVDSLDWKGLSGKEISERIMSRAKDGSIILCHNNSDHILDALPIVLLGLKNKGYKFVSMDEIVYKDNYYIDNMGKQRLKVH